MNDVAADPGPAVLAQRVDIALSDGRRILVEGPSRKSSADVPELMGRPACNRVVNLPAGPNATRLVGQMIDVRITETQALTLRGEVVVNEPA